MLARLQSFHICMWIVFYISLDLLELIGSFCTYVSSSTLHSRLLSDFYYACAILALYFILLKWHSLSFERANIKRNICNKYIPAVLQIHSAGFQYILKYHIRKCRDCQCASLLSPCNNFRLQEFQQSPAERHSGCRLGLFDWPYIFVTLAYFVMKSFL